MFQGAGCTSATLSRSSNAKGWNRLWLDFIVRASSLRTTSSRVGRRSCGPAGTSQQMYRAGTSRSFPAGCSAPAAGAAAHRSAPVKASRSCAIRRRIWISSGASSGWPGARTPTFAQCSPPAYLRTGVRGDATRDRVDRCFPWARPRATPRATTRRPRRWWNRESRRRRYAVSVACAQRRSPVASWIAGERAKGTSCAVTGLVSPAVGVAAAALDHDLDIRHVLFGWRRSADSRKTRSGRGVWR